METVKFEKNTLNHFYAQKKINIFFNLNINFFLNYRLMTAKYLNIPLLCVKMYFKLKTHEF